MFKQNLPDMHVVMLQITLLKGILEENGVDLAAVLSSAGVALTEEASSEYDDDDEEEDEEEEEAEEDMVASTAEGEAQSPGMAQSNFGLYRLLCICKAQIYLHAPALVYTGCEMFNILGSRCCRWTIVHTAFLDGKKLPVGIVWGMLMGQLFGTDAMHICSDTTWSMLVLFLGLQPNVQQSSMMTNQPAWWKCR